MESSHILLSPSWIASVMINIPHQGSTLVTINTPTLTGYYHPKSIIYSGVHF